MRFPSGSAGKESACSAGDLGSIPRLGRSPCRRERLPTPIFIGFPGSSAGQESACKVGDLGSIPELGRSPGGGHGNPLQYSCWRIPWTEEPGRLQPMGSQESARLTRLSSNSCGISSRSGSFRDTSLYIQGFCSFPRTLPCSLQSRWGPPSA